MNHKTLVMPTCGVPEPFGLLDHIFFWRMLPRYEARWRFVADQLACRDGATRDAWGESATRLRVLDVVTEAFRKEFDWPNVYYLPDDPLRALCVRRDWETELFAVAYDVEKNLHLRRNSFPLPPLETATLGTLVDAIVSICPAEELRRACNS